MMSRRPPLIALTSAVYSLLSRTNASVDHSQARRQPFPSREWLHRAEETDANSFIERHGLKLPPIISRKTRFEARSDVAETSIIDGAKSGEDPTARLRNDLIWSGYYDKNSYPWEYAWQRETDGNLTGVPVEMDINFNRVYSVETINPVLDLIVWFRLAWIDPRLTWDPAEYGNHVKTWFWISGGTGAGETSEIWTPDIELWNLDESLTSSLEDAYAVVSYDGSVFWSRPGHLRPACKFRGLENFPFDELSCTMELGSWSYSGKYLRLEKGGDDQNGFAQGGSNTAGESYHEFTFVEQDPITCEVYTYPPFGGNSPDTGWPVIFYNVTLQRAWQPYARGYICSQVLISFIGFSAFWLPPSCGERMGLSITALLAAIASDIVISANLPQAKEMTWFQKFSIISSLFTFLALVESVVVLYFFYSTSEDMAPKWYTFLKQRNHRAREHSLEVLAEATNSIHRTATRARDTVLQSLAPGREEEYYDCVSSESVSSVEHVQRNGRRTTLIRTQAIRVRDADDFMTEMEMRNNEKWKRTAARVDDVSRFWFPLAYTIAMSIVLSEALK